MAELNVAIDILTRDRASKPIAAIKSALAGLGDAATAPTRALGALANGLGKLGLAGLGIQAVTGAAQGLAGALGVGLASELEQTRAQFMAFTKDAGLTERLLADVRREADRTPFSFRELAAATASLIPASKAAKVPLEELRDLAQILAASNPAQGLEGAALALREAVSGDFVSIVERFNLPRKRIQELRASGVPDLEAIRTAMKEMGLDASLVAGMATTATGRWSTFMDTIDSLRLALVTPLFEGMKSGLAALQSILEENQGALTDFAASVGRGLGDLFSGLVRLIPTVVDGVRTFIGALSGTWQPAPGITQFHSIVGVIGQTIGVVRDGILTFIGAIQGTWEPAPGIQTFHVLVGSLGQIIGTVRDGVLTFIGALQGDWQPAPGISAFHTLVGQVGAGVAAARDTVQTFIGAMQGDWRPAPGVDAFHAAVGRVATAIREEARPMLDGLAAVLRDVVPGAADESNRAMAAFVPLWQGSLKPALIEYVEMQGMQVVGAMRATNTAWTTVLKPTWDALVQTHESSVKPVLLAWTDLQLAVAEKGMTAIRGAWEKVLKPALDALGSLLNDTINPAVRATDAALMGPATTINDLLRPALSGLQSLVESLPAPFRSLEGAANAVATAIRNLANSIRNLDLPDWLTPGSPTPFETGLRGINSALADTTRLMRSFGDVALPGQSPIALPTLEMPYRASTLPSRGADLAATVSRSSSGASVVINNTIDARGMTTGQLTQAAGADLAELARRRVLSGAL